MVFDRMFLQNDLIGIGMQASIVRGDVINNNIANADVPGFKKKTVHFESYFQNALSKFRKTGNLDFAELTPTIQLKHDGFSYRLDENNVNIESEMVDLYQNTVKYDTMVSGIINNYKRINLINTIK